MNVEWMTDEQCRAAGSMKWLAFDDDVIPAWVAEMDVVLPQGVKDALHKAVELNVAGYTGHAVPQKMGFNDSVAAWHHRRFGTEVDPDSVVLLPTVIAALRLVLDALLDPGDGVLVNTPVYFPFFTVIEENNYTLFDAPMAKDAERYRIDLQAVEASFQEGAKAIILCNPHNPTGSIATRAELEELARIADTYNALVISDEVHAPLTAPSKQFISYSDVSSMAAAHSVTISSTSKTYNTPGLRNAWLFTHNTDYLDALMGTSYEARNGASSLGISAAIGALDDCDDWTTELAEEIESRHDLLGSLLNKHLPKASVVKPEGGFLAWVDFSAYPKLGDDPAKWIRTHAKVALSSGPAFRGDSMGFARINVGTSAERLTRIVLRIADALG